MADDVDPAGRDGRAQAPGARRWGEPEGRGESLVLLTVSGAFPAQRQGSRSVDTGRMAVSHGLSDRRRRPDSVGGREPRICAIWCRSALALAVYSGAEESFAME